MLPVIPLCIVEEPRGAFSSGGFPATSDGAAGDPQSYPNFRLWEMAVYNGDDDDDKQCYLLHATSI